MLSLSVNNNFSDQVASDCADRQSWSVSAGFGLCGGMIVSDLATSQWHHQEAVHQETVPARYFTQNHNLVLHLCENQ